MGKTGEADQAAPRPSPVTSSGGFSGCWYGAAVCKIVNAKCVSVLLLAVGGFLSALFLLLHLRVSGAIPDDPGILAGKTPRISLSTRFHRKSRCGARYHSGSNNIDCTSI
ncbi:hypothetical protein PR202_gb09957 [Eleusine coracana subsp. coracana]|uniref:Uncharacterized protein n=1 Tax=Eleusine coracana subsp. coracana TaxID=191504 RepID=A0AAV5EIQ7_ELECO|nr:hypothetical protein PR202_gb09957 [Eleusine coracana subsp. coracana]